MLFGLKINYSKYFLLTLPITLGMILVLGTWYHAIGIVIIYIAAFINQLMLVKFVREFFVPEVAKMRNNLDKGEIVSLFIVKIFILIFGISLGVLFMGHHVIFPVINYVIQMFVLVFCLREKISDYTAIT